MDALANRLRKALGSSYELGPVLGRGGMAVVFRATDRRLRREVAIKVLPPELGYSPDLRTRFVREAQTAAQLSHPNIVQIFDVGESDELVWFVMALVEGETVRAKVEREGPQPISLVRKVLEEVAQALAYSHARGVVHRDIKPDNILIESVSRRAMVTDFGIAKALHQTETEVTNPGEIVGTTRYMAPEQALAEAVDGRADIYALGLVGYFMLSGTHALQGTTLQGIIAQHLRGARVELDGLKRRLPVPLITALDRSLQPAPADRFARAEEFAAALRQMGGELPDTPAAVRKLLRESERFFFTVIVGSLAIGLIGVERIPLALILIVGGLVAGQFAMAVEQAVRRGVGWSAIRRALYVEQAGRVEEITEAGRPRLGVAGLATLGLIFGGMVILGSGFGYAGDSWINITLYAVGSFGGLLAARVFGTYKIKRAVAGKSYARPRSMRILVLATLGGALAAGAMAGAVGGFMVLVIGGGMTFAASKLPRPQSTGAEAELREWKVPRWLDVVGSWLFGRFVRRGWRIGFEREQPAALRPALSMRAAEQLLKQVKQRAGEVTGSARVAAQDAARLANDLVAECRVAVKRFKPLAARMARLNEGVLASRTIGLGGSLEGELDQVEAAADALEAQVQEYVRMLDVLARGLQGTVQSRDTEELNQALERVRELSSAVSRAIAQVPVSAR